MSQLRQIKDFQAFEQLTKANSEGYWAVFKHSNRCSVSVTVKRMFEAGIKSFSPLSEIALVDVVADRDLSQAIAAAYGVKHESPQLIIGKGAEVLFHASHENIDAESLTEVIK